MQIKVLEVSEIIYICPKIFQNSEFQLFKTHPVLYEFFMRNFFKFAQSLVEEISVFCC